MSFNPNCVAELARLLPQMPRGLVTGAYKADEWNLPKTTRDRFDALRDAIVDAHPYDCPCVVALPIVDGHGPWLQWLRDETRGDGSSDARRSETTSTD